MNRLKGRTTSSVTTHIGFRFKPADDDIEELSYEVEPSSSSTRNDSSSKKMSDPLYSSHKLPSQTEKSKSVLEEKSSLEETSEPIVSHSKEGNVTEPPKEDGEKWKVFNELKGKITKTLEDRIHKDHIVVGVAMEKNITEGTDSDDSKRISISENDEKLDLESNMHSPERISQCDESDSNHLSPSVEATEFIDQFLFENDVNDEFEKSKCIITSLPEKPQKPFSTITSGAQSLLNQKKQKSFAKSHISMSFSSLIATRSQSTEEEYVETSESVKDEGPASLELVGETKDNSNEDDVVVDPSMENQLCNAKSRLKSHLAHLKSWNNAGLAFLFAFLSCIFAPLPSYLSGFILGTFLSSCIFGLFWWLMKPTRQREPFVLPDFNNMPLLTITEKTEETIHKGWMNELQTEYSPDAYHVNSTHSVYIRLDGSYLRISHPETNIQKRAMFNEPRHKVVFVHQRHYDITGAYVSLLPVGLSRTRLWSKKYPLCLSIPNSKQAILLDSSGSKLTEDNPCIVQGTKESPSKKFVPKINENNEVVLYLFARTDREKDDWYRRFTDAAKAKILGSSIPTSSSSISSPDHGSLENKRAISIDLGSLQLSSSVGSDCFSEAESEIDSDAPSVFKKKKKLQFDNYLASLLSPSYTDFSHSISLSSLKDKSEMSDQNSSAQNLLWANSLLGRLFFDFLTNDYWSKVVSERIQRKLSKIKVPYFIEELTVTEIDLGCALPKIHRASETVVNEQGLWVDLDLSYSGCFQMTLETKLNLLRLQKSPTGELTLNAVTEEKQPTRTTTRSDLCNSEEDDSAESSSDEESIPEVTEQATTEESSSPSAAGGSTSRKLLRFVDKIAQSPYFQHAAKNKYIKRAMEEVSNTPIVLTVEVQWFTGTLAINIPPLPTDRLWYGFRTNPHLSLVARPKLGGHAVKITHVIEWIEKKLISEFQKVLVMPNMGNIVIPIMHFNLPSQKS